METGPGRDPTVKFSQGFFAEAVRVRVEVEVRVAVSERDVEDVGIEERVRLVLRVDE